MKENSICAMPVLKTLQRYIELQACANFAAYSFPMYLFYTSDIQGDYAFLHEEEAAHCAQVLRRKRGDAISWVDGRGGRFSGYLEEVQKRQCMLKIESHLNEPLPREWNLHIAMAPTKNADRTEWFLEKAVEIGVDKFTPLVCEHSARKIMRHDRLEKIAIAAMKQSMQSRLPQIAPPANFKDFVTAQDSLPQARFVAHCHEDDAKSSLRHNCHPGKNVCVMIGPEGDFSVNEVAMALDNGFLPVSLGNTRLRTETAALYALQTVHFINS
jgi:16S rRNA (uracil1498-N3)-methyltransferase